MLFYLTYFYLSSLSINKAIVGCVDTLCIEDGGIGRGVSKFKGFGLEGRGSLLAPLVSTSLLVDACCQSETLFIDFVGSTFIHFGFMHLLTSNFQITICSMPTPCSYSTLTFLFSTLHTKQFRYFCFLVTS